MPSLAQLWLQAEALKAAVATPDAATPRDLVENLKRLFKYLEDASDDALAFANQAQQDAKRHSVQPDGSGTGEQDPKESATEDTQTVRNHCGLRVQNSRTDIPPLLDLKRSRGCTTSATTSFSNLNYASQGILCALDT